MTELLQLHATDNVALTLGNIKSSDICSVSGEPEKTLLIHEDIPKMHKVALCSIDVGEPIKKYGQVIGYASKAIVAGQHVHGHNCMMGEVAKDYDFCKNAVATSFVPEEKRATFQGYKRASGKTGTRNYIGIITTVNCSSTVARQIAAHYALPGNLDGWANVDGVVALTHSSGCGMRDGDEGYETLRRTFEGYLRHPNFGGVLLVGLGCETMQVEKVLQESGLANSDLFQAYTIQESGGTRAAIDKGITYIESILPNVNQCSREITPASELILAVQCGGSDAFSGITANPALGIAGDILVRHGGTVIYSETPEIYGAEHLLTQRAVTPEVAEKVLERIRWWEEYTRANGFELDNNPSPGNKQGGLTTILEKSLGAQAKSGSTMLMDVYKYAEPVKAKGLVFMDSPGFDPVSVTGQVASGANVVCFTTGRGSAFGYKPVPSIKLSSNSDVYKNMQEDIDINCGLVIDGEKSLNEMGEEIFSNILAVASGEPTKSELLGYGDTEFNPWKIGAVL